MMLLLWLGFFDWVVFNACGGVLAAGYLLLNWVELRRAERAAQMRDAGSFLAALEAATPIEGQTLRMVRDELGRWYPEQHHACEASLFDSMLADRPLDPTWTPPAWQSWYAEVA